MPKVSSDETAATRGEGLSSGLSPSSATTCSRSAVSGSRDSWTATWCGEAARRRRARAASRPARRARPRGCARARAAPCPPRGRAARSASSPTCTRRAPSRSRRRPGRPTPASTIARGAAPPPPTPATSAVLVTSPSIAPNTAARSQPPETSAWLWSCASASGEALACGDVTRRPRRPAPSAAPPTATGTATLGHARRCRPRRAGRRRRRCPGRGCRAPSSPRPRPAAGRRTRAGRAAGWRPTGCPASG